MNSNAIGYALLAILICASTGLETKDEHDPFQYIEGFGYYHLVETLYNWTQAYEHCQSLGSLLAVANSDKEAEHLTNLAGSYPSTTEFAYVGVSDLNLRREFITVEGVLIGESGYNQWTGKEPSLIYRCAGISKSGEGLTPEDCALESHSICEIPTWRRQYTLVDGIGYYKAYPGGWAWPQAMMACKKDGAHLAIINTEEEYHAVQMIFNEQLPDKPTVTFDDFVWLGGHSQFNYMNYVTVFGVPLNATGFNHWAPGQPGDSPGYLGIERNGYLATRYAYTAYPFAYGAICEHALY